MTDQYQEVNISLVNQSAEIAEILIAQLAELGYDGFLEEADCLKAYIPTSLFSSLPLTNMLANFQLESTVTSIDKQNWNILWESNFSPMQVDEFVGVRAAFHEPIPNVVHELIITPKMSFGTGHHATTYMMMRQMRQLDFTGKKVFDFGTGTGVLAILAEKGERLMYMPSIMMTGALKMPLKIVQTINAAVSGCNWPIMPPVPAKQILFSQILIRM